MKRSHTNQALKELEDMCEKNCGYLPPFCHFTPEQRQSIDHDYDKVRNCMLDWDITDYGVGDSDILAFSLITLRNENRAMVDNYSKVYVEKLLYLKEGQYASNHFQWYKTEDIINRVGGNVLIRIRSSLSNEENDYEPDAAVYTASRINSASVGTQICLTPGERIHVQQYLYHAFSEEKKTGSVLLGKVSMDNDDTGNRCNPTVGRFPKIRDYEPQYRLLCNEFPKSK